MERFQYKQFTAEEIDEIVKNTGDYMNGGGLQANRPPFSTAMVGKKLKLCYDEGIVISYDFIDLHKLIWQAEGEGEKHEEYYEALDADDGITLVVHIIKGTSPQQARMTVFDFKENLVTTFFAKIGNQFSTREVHRDICFGYIDCGKIPESRHSLTQDLVGRSIIWTYSPKFTIQHMYSSDCYSAFVDYSTYYGGMILTSPSNYVKINEYTYIYSWVEIEGAGVQGFALMNLYTMHDVGCFFGINGSNKFESYTFGAVGKYAGQLANLNIKNIAWG